MTKEFTQDKLKITGKIILRSYRAGTEELIEEIITPNMIMQGANTGLDLIIQRLIGNNTYSLNIGYGEIGTGSTVVATADVGNTTPFARATVSFGQDWGNSQAILQFFFPDSALTNQTYYEFATFIDGTAALGSGQIFNHALFSAPYVKTSGKDTTVQVVFTVSQ